MRANAARGAPSRADWRQVNSFSAQIRRLRRQRRRERKREVALEIRQAAESRSTRDVSEVLRKAARESDAARLMGHSMDRREYTKYFCDVPQPPKSVPLQRYLLPRRFEQAIATAIRKAKPRKAPGPDGVPMELFKLDPDMFALLLYELYAACARCAYVVEGWDSSILIPIFKKGDTARVENYRPLRLILIIRKIFEIALEPSLLEEVRDEPEQFGFLARTSAIAPALIVVANMRHGGHIFPLDFAKAYDRVDKAQLNADVAACYSPAVAAAVASLLQPSLVRTVGDESMLTLAIDRGLLQGGPLSPRLFNFSARGLITCMRDAVAHFMKTGDASPFCMFADDVALQILLQLLARRMFRAAAAWAEAHDHEFNMKPGKSAQLVGTPSTGHPLAPEQGAATGFVIGDKPLLADTAVEYLGVPLQIGGPTDAKLRDRAQAASAALSALKERKLLVRGMAIRAARTVYKTFISSVWTYACFIAPLSVEATRQLDAVDAGYISATLLRCTTEGALHANGTRNDAAKLSRCRAMIRIDSPELLRQVTAHQAVRSLHRTATDAMLPDDIRERARHAIHELRHVPTILALVADVDNPWSKAEIVQQRAAAWDRANRMFKRKIPPPGPGQAFFPAAMSLQQPWARTLAARYLTNAFPALTRTASATVRARTGKRSERAQKTPTEVAALEDLPLLQQPVFAEGEETRALRALSTLRPRDEWAGLRTDASA